MMFGQFGEIIIVTKVGRNKEARRGYGIKGKLRHQKRLRH